MSKICRFKNDCSGCTEWDFPYPQQLETKAKHFKSLLQDLGQPINFEMISIAEYGLRDRLDFVIQDSKVGLYVKDSREIIDLPECLQMSPALREFYSDFRKIKIPIQKGSIRLRFSPQGDRGMWLDFSNLDIKNLLNEKSTLLDLLKFGFVEIGQRRKKLSENLKLIDPELKSWTRTWNNGQPISLYQCVSHFSQVGDSANRKISETISVLIENAKAQDICEFGSGNGNLTFAYLRPYRKATCLEIQDLALEGLKRTAQESGFKNIKTITGDFQNKSKLNLQNFDTVVANPPRSGLMNFTNEIVTLNKKPPNLVYMSCYPESFLKDSRALVAAGYQLEEAFIIDQFPQTKHYEILVRFKIPV